MGDPKFTQEYGNEASKRVEVYGFKCENCGNNMQYKPTTTMLECPYCGTTKEIDNISLVQEQILFENDFQESKKDNSIHVYRCASCGGVSETMDDSMSFMCPYCNKTNLIEEVNLKGIKPTGILPFKITKQECKYSFGKFLKKRFFTPNVVKKRDNVFNINGIYLPCWTFDADIVSDYDGVLGERKTRRVGVGKDARTETYIDYYPVRGTYQRSFDEVTIQASDKVEEKEFNKVYEYPTNNAISYSEAFLAGYYANHYTVDLKDAYKDARGIMDETIVEEIKNMHRADVVKSMNLNSDVNNVKYKYILLPMYLATFEYKKKLYRLIMNGISGKIGGKYPLSPWKVFGTVLAGLGIVAIIAIIVLFLNGEIKF